MLIRKLLQDELPEEKHFPFDEPFQDSILKLMLNGNQYAPILVTAVEPEYFDGKERSTVAFIIKTLFEEYKVPVSISTIENTIRGRGLGKSDTSLLLKFVRRLSSIEPESGEHIVDQTLEFCRRKAVTNVILDCPDLLKRGDVDKIQKSLEKAISSTSKIALASEYFETVGSRLKQSTPQEKYMMTLIPKLDEVLFGLKRKELFVWLAPTGRGKSHALVHLGKAAVIQGLTVLHISLELGEDELKLRYDASFSGIPINDIYADRLKVISKVEKINKSTNGKLFIIEHPTGSLSVEGIRAILELYKSRGVIIDVLILDYADLLHSKNKYTEKRHELSSNYIYLRGLLSEYNIFGATASQSNRSSLDKKVVSIEDISEDLGKAMVSDVMVSICQTQLEKRENILRLWVCKCRRNRDAFLVKIHSGYDRGMFYDVAYSNGDIEQVGESTISMELENELNQ